MACIGYTIQDCEQFRTLVQSMMYHREIEIFEKKIEDSMNVIIGAEFVGGSSS